MALFRDLIFCIFSTKFFEIFLLILANWKGISDFFMEFLSLTRFSNLAGAANVLLMLLDFPVARSLVAVVLVVVVGVECVYEKEKEMGILL